MIIKKYVVAVCEDASSEVYIPFAGHIERNDSLWPGLQIDDLEAAKIAEMDGVRLIYGMDDVEDGVYIDTPKNRSIIQKNIEKYPEYKLVKLHGHIPDATPETDGEDDWEMGDDDM